MIASVVSAVAVFALIVLINEKFSSNVKKLTKENYKQYWKKQYGRMKYSYLVTLLVLVLFIFVVKEKILFTATLISLGIPYGVWKWLKSREKK